MQDLAASVQDRVLSVVRSVLKQNSAQPGSVMESAMNILLRALTAKVPLRVRLTQEILKRFPVFSYESRLEAEAVERPHYGFCIYEAARLASSLGYDKFSVLELGCGGGNGLISAEMHIKEIRKIFPVEIELYGFDMGSGLPPPKDYRDFPHYFRGGQYAMDQSKLRDRLGLAKLLIGDINDTRKSFFKENSPAPVGCVFVDLDFYSSTKDALHIFDEKSANFLPRVFMYFDDITGADNVWLPCEFTGEMLAIEEFNREHDQQKIVKNRSSSLRHRGWGDLIYVYHDFGHSKYNEFVGRKEQEDYEEKISLR
jgi:hypothetical protein